MYQGIPSRYGQATSEYRAGDRSVLAASLIFLALIFLEFVTLTFGISLLFVTHDFGVVAELCDDLCVIYAGQTVEAGTVQSILAAPAHPYTRALLACHPDRATSFVGIPGLVPSPLARPSGCLFAPRCGDVQPICLGARPAQGRALSGAAVRCVQYA